MSKPTALDGISSRFEGMQFVVETRENAKVYEIEYLVAVLLVTIARSDGEISPAETDEMLQLVGNYFHMRSAASLDLLAHAVTDLSENQDLTELLQGWSIALKPADKEDIAVMMLKVVAADGDRNSQEMDMFHKAADIIDISNESLHKAFNRFFDDGDA
ncbi:MAG: TerB family tellurite resistance protein [Halioglobus sp.]